ncbi:telomerase protein component 1 isoform X1 [Tachysurus ichikawai]
MVLSTELIVCGDSKGHMWFNETPTLSSLPPRKPVGLFVCGAPVEVLQVNPNDQSQIMCGDALGQIYFLSWRG